MSPDDGYEVVQTVKQLTEGKASLNYLVLFPSW